MTKKQTKKNNSSPNSLTISKNWTALIKKRLKVWRSRPDQFVEQLFGIQPEDWQREALLALTKNNRLAVRSGHGVGKTSFLAWSILWWLFTRHPAKIACTAPTSHQLADNLWGEISKWHRKLHPTLQEMIDIHADKVSFKASGKTSFAVARTARKEQPEAFQGFHSKHMLFIVDEASGVDDIIFEVGQGALSTAGAKVIMTGNPTRNSGFFHRAFHKNRSEWYCMHVPCTNSSQVNHHFMQTMAKQYGADSQTYKVRVLGEFPKSEDDTVIDLSDCEAAIEKHVDIDETIYPVWGLDVARFGNDKTCLVKRHNNKVTDIKSWSNKDTMQITGLIVDEYEQTAHPDRPNFIYTDVIGIGAGVVDRLRELGYPVIGVNVCEQASQNIRFDRLRDELWFLGKEWFEKRNVSIPNHDAFLQDLTAIRYKINSNGKLKVESKNELKKRGIPSPDIADAFCLTFAGRYDQRKDDFQDYSQTKRTRYKSKPHNGSWMSS